jgi:acyl-CoA thioester hydrolase
VGDLKGKYPLVISQDLIWADMDAFQHINNAVYFRYFEDARMAYMDRTQIVEYKNRTQIGPILASTRCDFRVPLTFPDTIQVATYIEDIELKRFKMKYIVYSEQLKKVAAEGEGLIVYYDYQKKVSCEIPEVILSSIKAMQLDYE